MNELEKRDEAIKIIKTLGRIILNYMKENQKKGISFIDTMEVIFNALSYLSASSLISVGGYPVNELIDSFLKTFFKNIEFLKKKCKINGM